MAALSEHQENLGGGLLVQHCLSTFTWRLPSTPNRSQPQPQCCSSWACWSCRCLVLRPQLLTPPLPLLHHIVRLQQQLLLQQQRRRPQRRCTHGSAELLLKCCHLLQVLASQHIVGVRGCSRVTQTELAAFYWVAAWRVPPEACTDPSHAMPTQLTGLLLLVLLLLILQRNLPLRQRTKFIGLATKLSVHPCVYTHHMCVSALQLSYPLLLQTPTLG
ncbi:hypothetical protein COO60DRAFT_1539256 [Scenedesmus sp. NREL 46B-D3]|nr:hypothetical protein COO60DRAFT_1539256 [Scenedesmus sp. NREL 46B-D3]